MQRRLIRGLVGLGTALALGVTPLTQASAQRGGPPRFVPPSVSISNAQVVEGNSGRRQMMFSITLSAPSTRDTVVFWATRPGTADRFDYVNTASASVIRQGQIATSFPVLVNGDTTVEPDETFSVVLLFADTAVINRREGTGTIVNDDAAAVTLSSIAIAAPASLVRGTSAQSSITGTYSDGTQSPITNATFTATGAVSVSAAGLITANTVGAGTVTATFQGKTTTTNITVTEPPRSLASIAIIAPTSLEKGKTAQATVTGTYSDNTTSPIVNPVYSATGAVSVSASGLITATTVGSGTVTATFGGQTATATINVTAPTVVSLAVSFDFPNVPKGIESNATATATYSDGSTATVVPTWTISGGSTISGTGKIDTLPAVPGPATVTATFNGVTANATLTVRPAEPRGVTVIFKVNGVEVAPLDGTVPRGATVQVTVESPYTDKVDRIVPFADVVWTAEDNLTITPQGVVSTTNATGLSLITATVQAFYEGTTTIPITVGRRMLVVAPELLSIAIDGPARAIGTVPTQYSLTGTYTDGVRPIPNEDATWSTTLGTIANGLLTAANSATTSTDLPATLSVEVGTTTATKSISISPNVVSLKVTIVSERNPPLDSSLLGAMWFGAFKDPHLVVSGTLADGSTADVTGGATFVQPSQFKTTISTGGVINWIAQDAPVTITRADRLVVTAGAASIDINPLFVFSGGRTVRFDGTAPQTKEYDHTVSLSGDPFVVGVFRDGDTRALIPCADTPQRFTCDAIRATSSDVSVASIGPSSEIILHKAGAVTIRYEWFNPVTRVWELATLARLTVTP